MDPIGLEDLCRPQRDRWNRALVDARICVLDVTNVDDDSSYLLTMQGTTDIYTISVPYMTGRPMKCTCFDAKKRKDLNCKHVLKACQVFGLLTPVMDDIAIASPFEDSKLLFHLMNQEPLTLSESEIDKIHNVMRLRGLKSPSAPVAAATLEDPCAVCFEAIEAGTSIFECKTCKKTVHDECWKAWNRAGRRSCVYCRSV